jgi:hypothetical protein
MYLATRITAGRLALLGGLLLFLFAPATLAQTASLWTDVAEPARAASERQVVPEAYRTVLLDRAGMAAALAQAPEERAARGTGAGLVLSLPMPDGTFADFRVVASSIMAPGLQARYPQLRTYLGQGITRPSATVRISDTPKGFRALVLQPGGSVYIDPYSTADTEHHIVYNRRDFTVEEARLLEAFANEVVEPDEHHADDGDVAERSIVENGEILRTHRLAVATTGEYTIFHSEDNTNPTVEEGLEAVVVAMNRVNGIYEREIAVRMELVENNDEIIFTDPVTDPYTNNSGGAMLAQNQTTLDNIIGPANYDIGHVFSTGGGGIAGLGVVCVNGSKARGVTGLPAPINDPFYVDYVAHEIGHQYRGNHTFNSLVCAGNRNASTAYEPGGGTTIMAYAGICGADNLQGPTGTTQFNSNDYFHNISLTEMVNFITNLAGGTCGTTEETGNTPPEVSAESGFSIPIETPFVLTGSATDAETPEALTFTWEEMDLGPASAPPGRPTWNEQPPFFRSFEPTEDSTRTFPLYNRLLGGLNPIIGERLPLDGRTLRFRFTARDNAAGGGGISDIQIVLFTDASAGPFVVTYPDADTLAFATGSELEVTWDVAGTDGGNVNTEFVDILYSDDDGETFLVLLEATENDGAATITLPEAETTEARIMVRAVDNIFFAVNPEPFSVLDIVVSNEAQPGPATHALGAVYPNPFGLQNARATFNLAVEQTQQVRVAVYDALGREVAVLHEGVLGAGLNRQFALRADDLAAGVYFVRAVGETFADVRPFTVAR